jgi:glycerate 2-kinase
LIVPIRDPCVFLTDVFLLAVVEADPMQVVPRHLPERGRGWTLVIWAGKASSSTAEALESAGDRARVWS